MTKEEIIHRLQYARHRIDNVTYAPDVLKAIDIAIETVGNTDTDSDTISRKEAIEAADAIIARDTSGNNDVVNAMIAWREYIKYLPSAQPDIIRCRNCKFASGDSRICMKFGHSPIGELDFCAWAERRTDE